MTSSRPPPVLLIAGPTASGKSALALRLAEAHGGEIVNADALQVYRDLRVLTARPTDQDLTRAPHHLFGIADGAEPWSAGRWLRAADETLAGIAARGRQAIVVGGTGLYLRALTHGLAEIPPVAPSIRDDVARRFGTLGEAAFREALHRIDPAAEARIAPGDRQRLIRAFEVHAATARSLTDWQAQTRPLLAAGAWRAVALEPDRQTLYRRCDARLGLMVRGGALEEVRALMARGLDPAAPVLKAVGVREFAAYLAGEFDVDEALARARQETRRYAKRQLTWLRNQTPDWPRLTSEAEIAAWPSTAPMG